MVHAWSPSDSVDGQLLSTHFHYLQLFPSFNDLFGWLYFKFICQDYLLAAYMYISVICHEVHLLTSVIDFPVDTCFL